MLDFSHSFKDIESYIEHLKSRPEVVGIVEYGGRTSNDMSPGGDYDLTVILDKPISTNLNGVHFHIAGIPVDCMILSINEFLVDSPITDFLLVHLNCTILFDRNDRISSLLDQIKVTWKPSKELSDFEIHFYRFVFRHNLDKLEHRLLVDPLYSRYMIFSTFDFYLQCYARVHGLELGKVKTHLNHIKETSPKLYKQIEELYSSGDLSRQFDILKTCAIKIIEPIGTIWENNEILLHLLPGGTFKEKDEREVIELLFQK
ncbi:MAG: hypothetical protein OCD02_18645 [Spirochaetaceae bacterium]